MFTDFWTQIVSTDLLSSFELRIIAVILKRLNFRIWMTIDYESITKKLDLDETEVKKVVQKLIIYQIVECKGDSVQQDYYRYRLNRNFGWNKPIDWIFADGIDWQAFLISFQKLQNKFKLIIKAIENQSEGNLIIRLEISAFANRVEVERCLKHEYQVELEALKKKYKIKYNDQELAINRHNNANLLKVIKLIVNTSNPLDNIVNIEAIPKGESRKLVLKEKNISNQRDTAINYPQISSQQKQTLVEAVAEKEKLSQQLDLTKVSKTAYLDDYIDTQDQGSFLKSKIRARLNKHSY